ncbi:alpha/beta hydrolase [Yoonia sp.]|uniref:alpha/beta hydrolase n=1 Tax=Yoonia sp. TaxID=2212373 RepID=UPI002DFF95A0|nr:alpha/beta hydrolase fold domain-containing protein [Yoonia sp.]
MRLALLNLALRYGVKPLLGRASNPEREARKFERIGPVACPPPPFLCHLTEDIRGLCLHWISVGRPAPRKVIFYLHGGAYFAGSGQAYRGLLGRLSKVTGLRVCAPDYRLLQVAPFPAAFEDTVATWNALMAKGYRPGDIVLGGDSAGGGLMLALLAHLCATGQRPAAAFAFSPWVDLTLSGQSLHKAPEVLLPVGRMPEVVARYLAGADPKDPRASPLFAVFDQSPPVLIQVGGDEALFDDAKRMAEKLGPAAQLQILPSAPHVLVFFARLLPQARVALRDVASFVHTSLVIAKR